MYFLFFVVKICRKEVDILQAKDTAYNGLDLAKFIFCFFIIAIHTNPFIEISYPLNYFLTQYIGRMAVPFFFAASGFLLYRKMSVADGMDMVRVKKYLRHILRLYIVYTVIYFPVYYIQYVSADPKGIQHGLLEFVHATVISGSYWHLWFLLALIVAAIIVTWMLSLGWSWKRIFFVTWMLHLVCLIGKGGYYAYLPSFIQGSSVLSWLEDFFITPANGIFFGSLYLAIGACVSQQKKEFRMSSIVSNLFGFLILYFVECMGGRWLNINSGAWVYFSLIPVTYYILLLAKTVSLPDTSCWRYLRRQSMLIFYFHPWFVVLASWFLWNRPYSIADIGTFPRFR